jgi:hypothetical protein
MVDFFDTSGGNDILLPQLQTAFQRDPRRMLIQSLMQQGQASLQTPTLSPGAALAKALTIGLGGLTGAALQQDYADQSQQAMADLKTAQEQSGGDATKLASLLAGNKVFAPIIAQKQIEAAAKLAEPQKLGRGDVLIVGGKTVASNDQPDTELSKLIAARDKLAPDDPNRAVYDAQISKITQEGGVRFTPGGAAAIPGFGEAKGQIAGAEEAGKNPALVSRAVSIEAGTAPIKVKQAIDTAAGTAPIEVKKAIDTAAGTAPIRTQEAINTAAGTAPIDVAKSVAIERGKNEANKATDVPSGSILPPGYIVQRDAQNNIKVVFDPTKALREVGPGASLVDVTGAATPGAQPSAQPGESEGQAAPPAGPKTVFESPNPSPGTQPGLIDKFLADTFQQNETNAQTGRTKIGAMKQLNDALDGIQTGKFAGTTLDLMKMAQAAGLSTEGMNQRTGALEAANAIGKQLAMEMRNFPGAVSDYEQRLLAEMAPGIETTPQGRKMMLELAERRQARNEQLAKIGRDYLTDTNGKGRLDVGYLNRLEEFAKNNGLTGVTTAAGKGNAETPPVPNARKAPDGNWYVPDPNRAGKFLMVKPNG